MRTLIVVALLEETVDTTDWELQTATWSATETDHGTTSLSTSGLSKFAYEVTDDRDAVRDVRESELQPNYYAPLPLTDERQEETQTGCARSGEPGHVLG